jgi:hypothetical protein
VAVIRVHNLVGMVLVLKNGVHVIGAARSLPDLLTAASSYVSGTKPVLVGNFVRVILILVRHERNGSREVSILLHGVGLSG